MSEKTIYDLPDMAMTKLAEYIKGLALEHRAIRDALIKEGKSYRSHRVSYQHGYMNALSDVVDFIDSPGKAQQIRQAIRKMAVSNK